MSYMYHPIKPQGDLEVKYHDPILQMRKPRPRDITGQLESGRAGIGAEASQKVNPKLPSTSENGPRLLSVAEYGFSHTGAHLHPFLSRGLSSLCNARPFLRTVPWCQGGH